MLPLNSPAASFLAIPAELRKSIYEASDKQSLGRLAQTCKQVNAEINPPVKKFGQETRSPWNTLRKRDYPEVGVPGIKKPLSGRVLYRAAKLENKKQLLVEVMILAAVEGHVADTEPHLVWCSIDEVKSAEAYRK